MTGPLPRVEALGEHAYLVYLTMDDDVVTVRVNATPDVVSEIAGDDADEPAVVSAPVAYLTARQRPADLPEQLDLDDVVAAYDDFVVQLRETLSAQAEGK